MCLSKHIVGCNLVRITTNLCFEPALRLEESLVLIRHIILAITLSLKYSNTIKNQHSFSCLFYPIYDYQNNSNNWDHTSFYATLLITFLYVKSSPMCSKLLAENLFSSPYSVNPKPAVASSFTSSSKFFTFSRKPWIYMLLYKSAWRDWNLVLFLLPDPPQTVTLSPRSHIWQQNLSVVSPASAIVVKKKKKENFKKHQVRKTSSHSARCGADVMDAYKRFSGCEFPGVHTIIDAH